MADLIQEHTFWVQVWMLAIQFLALLGLIWYTCETRGVRKAAEEQVRVSQRLIGAAMDQVEGLSKPCLTLDSRLRDGADAILEADGAVGNTVAVGNEGSFVLHNIGNGIALNVSYRFVHLPIDPDRHVEARRFVQNALAGQRVRMAEPLGPYDNGEWEVQFEYQSIGGRRYSSVVTIHNLVLTAIQFGPTLEQ